jgi:hypothetical protein
MFEITTSHHPQTPIKDESEAGGKGDIPIQWIP